MFAESYLLNSEDTGATGRESEEEECSWFLYEETSPQIYGQAW